MASNVHYRNWERGVAIGDEATPGTVSATPKLFPTLTRPKININPEFVDTGETGRGSAERSQTEFALGVIRSGATFDARAGNVTLYNMLRYLLQQKPAGVETPASSGKFRHRFQVYSQQPSTNHMFTIWDAWRTGATGHSKRVVGNILSKLALTSDVQQQYAKLDMESVGMTGIRDTLTSPAGAWANALLYMHRHLIVAKVGSTSFVPSPAKLSIAATTDPRPWFGGSQTPTEETLGQFNITGAFTLSARQQGSDELDRFLAKANAKLTFGFGTVVNDVGYSEWVFDATYSGADDTDVDDIIGIDLPFVSALAETSPTTTTIDVWHSADLSV